jgi:predicted transcriptional regulator
MTNLQAQVIALFKTLDPKEQREVAAQIYADTFSESFYDRMTVEQRAQLDAGIAEADRGQVVPAEEAFDRLAKRFGFAAERRSYSPNALKRSLPDTSPSASKNSVMWWPNAPSVACAAFFSKRLPLILASAPIGPSVKSMRW